MRRDRFATEEKRRDSRCAWRPGPREIEARDARDGGVKVFVLFEIELACKHAPPSAWLGITARLLANPRWLEVLREVQKRDPSRLVEVTRALRTPPSHDSLEQSEGLWSECAGRCDGNGDGDGDGYGNGNGYGDGNGDGDGYGNGDGNGYGYGGGYGGGYGSGSGDGDGNGGDT